MRQHQHQHHSQAAATYSVEQMVVAPKGLHVYRCGSAKIIWLVCHLVEVQMSSEAPSLALKGRVVEMFTPLELVAFSTENKYSALKPDAPWRRESLSGTPSAKHVLLQTPTRTRCHRDQVARMVSTSSVGRMAFARLDLHVYS